MLDRNKNIGELALTIFMSTLVSVFASLILCERIYEDMLLILFCYIVASCHYSLLKSVQPDSSSPIHGFNSLTALSRPVYFCLLCSFILALRYLMSGADSSTGFIETCRHIGFYGFQLNTSHFRTCLYALEIILLFFPLMFTLGLFPQISTFLICLMEHCDMHLFGGTSMNNLPGALLSVLRSILSVLMLASVLCGAIYSIPNVMTLKWTPVNQTLSSQLTPARLAATHNQFSQSVVFSIYCGLLVLAAYVLSRQTSDPQVYFDIFKQFLRDKLKRPSVVKEVETATSKETFSLVSLDVNRLKPTEASNSKSDQLPVSDNSLGSGSSSYNSLTINLINKSSNAAISAKTSILKSESTGLSSKKPAKNLSFKSTSNEKVEATTKTPKISKGLSSSEPLDYHQIDLTEDPLEKKTKQVICARFESDSLIGCFIFVIVFAVHVSTVFSSLKPLLNDVLFVMAIVLGALNHYVWPHLRLENPWYLFSQPVLKPNHWHVFEPSSLAKLAWFERIHVALTFFEKNVLNMLVILSSITVSSDDLLLKFNLVDPHGLIACLVISAMSLKLVRHSFCEPSKQYKIFLIAFLFNKFDSSSLGGSSDKAAYSHKATTSNETILVDLFVISVFLEKLHDFIEKMAFIFIYTAPWQV